MKLDSTCRIGMAWSDEEDGKLLLMAEAGFTIQDAAKHLGRTCKSVRLRYADLKGITRRDMRNFEPSLRLQSFDVLRPGASIKKAFQLLLRAAP